MSPTSTHHIGHGLAPEIEVLVVDDNAPAGTGALAEVLGRETGRVSVLQRTGKQGLGTTDIAGFKDALARGHERIVAMDGECSHRPADLLALRRAAETAAVVSGSRHVPGGRVANWSFLRHRISVEVHHQCHRAGLQVVEGPIVLPDRKVGRSKLPWRIAMEATTRVWHLRRPATTAHPTHPGNRAARQLPVGHAGPGRSACE
jgi:hypothetical protein